MNSTVGIVETVLSLMFLTRLGGTGIQKNDGAALQC